MDGQRVVAIKVTVLIVASLSLLTLFVLSMGGFSLKGKYDVYVGFDNPFGLKVGAPVEIAGVQVGSVVSLTYVGGGADPSTGEPQPMVMARVRIRERYQRHIHDDAAFVITTRGLLAEQLMVIDPGSYERPPLPQGATVRGEDPPRIDRVLAETSEFFTSATTALREARPSIRSSLMGAMRLLRETGTFMERNEGRVDALGIEVEQQSLDAVEIVRDLRRQYVDHPRVDRTIADIDRSAAVAAREVPRALSDARQTVADARRGLHRLARDDAAAVRGALDDADAMAAEARRVVRAARESIEPIRRGDSALSAVLLDEKLYDDLREMVHHLKKRPWKLFWKE